MCQKDIVKDYLKNKSEATIKEIAEDTDILEPNIRRILGQGEKKGIFQRISRGVYKVIITIGTSICIHHASALDTLPNLIEQGEKADMVFLDIPYDTPAVKGGNRGVKYDLINVPQFEKILGYSEKLLRKETSCIVYMYSNAPSGIKQMSKYTDCFDKFGFRIVGRGSYSKFFKNGKMATNVSGKVMTPEGITIYSKSDTKQYIDLDYKELRFRGYPTEKSSNMIADLIRKTTDQQDVIIDPFAGSGVIGEQSSILGRNSILIDSSEKSIEYMLDRFMGETRNIPF
jgi:DNA modification methylase